MTTKSPVAASVAPWLSVRNGMRAAAFYKAAFGRVLDPFGHHWEIARPAAS